MSSYYKLIEVIGTSEVSWDDAAKNALEVAGQRLADLRVAEVTRCDIKIDQGKIIYRTRLNVSFKYVEGGL
ncbi:MAG: dodecin domain-containing protein [Pirellulales bacterium]|nr:dodecin domain-containing protein [Pirellulales bacterium]MBX3435619.1 dodecin domain-containing protein [Pirellulales bacterium]